MCFRKKKHMNFLSLPPSVLLTPRNARTHLERSCARRCGTPRRACYWVRWCDTWYALHLATGSARSAWFLTTVLCVRGAARSAAADPALPVGLSSSSSTIYDLSFHRKKIGVCLLNNHVFYAVSTHEFFLHHRIKIQQPPPSFYL